VDRWSVVGVVTEYLTIVRWWTGSGGQVVDRWSVVAVVIEYLTIVRWWTVSGGQLVVDK
jgi:hypothetical protein